MSLQSWHQLMHLLIIAALLSIWLIFAYDTPALQTVSAVLVKTVGPLAEVVMLLAIVGGLLSVCGVLVAGPYIEQWSHPSKLVQALVAQIFVSALLSAMDVFCFAIACLGQTRALHSLAVLVKFCTEVGEPPGPSHAAVWNTADSSLMCNCTHCPALNVGSMLMCRC